MPGIIPDSVLEQVRQANDIVEVIGGYFPLKRRGANFIALCPFHKEKTPSFNVHPQRQIWHCFGCGAGGDVFGFVMKYENLPFVDAVRRLAERGGVQLELAEAPGAPTRDQKDALYHLHEAVARFYHQRLLTDRAAEPARAYLQKRQINIEIAKRWRLGYAPDAWDSLLQWAGTQRLKVPLLEAAGLVLPRERGDGHYDRFRGRLMIPICDEQARVIAFSGRILADAPDQPKYVNSPETPIFQKGKVLFALDRAKRPLLDSRFAVVCEGQFDTIACHEAGFGYVVAPQGTALTEQHARVLKRYVDEVVLLFDADEAGQKAAVRSADALLGAGLAIRVATLPPGHDPDSFVRRQGADSLQQLINGAPGYFEFFLARLAREYNLATPAGKMSGARAVVECVQKIPSAVLQSGFLRQAAATLGVPDTALAAEISRSRPRFRPGSDAEQPSSLESTLAAPPAGAAAEELLLRLMLTDDRAVAEVADRLDPHWLSGSAAAELIRQTVRLHQQGAWSGSASLLNRNPPEEAARLLSRLLLEPALPTDRYETAVADGLRALERAWVEAQWRQLQDQIARPGQPRQALADLQQRVLDLRRRLDHISQLSTVNSSRPQHQA